MPTLLKYSLRYTPLVVLALLLIPLRLYMAEAGRQPSAPPASSATSPFEPGTALYGVAQSPSGDIWAVGGSFSQFKSDANNGTSSFPIPATGIIMHYTGGAWVPGNVANFLRQPLLSASLDSARDGWAVGWSGALVHFDGNEWTTEVGPANFNKNLLGVDMLSPVDGWAVGYSGSILHYDGRRWTQVLSPTALDLHGIAMVSAQEGWAVGANGVILHYVNGTWNMFSPSPTNNTLNSVTMLSANEGWAVGEHGTILHYRDGLWQNVHPARYYQNAAAYQADVFYNVAMNSIRSGLIAGGQRLLSYSAEAWVEPPHTISINAIGKPGQVSPGNLNLYAITLSSTGECWAVGSVNDVSSTSNEHSAVALHGQNGTWSLSFVTGG